MTNKFEITKFELQKKKKWNHKWEGLKQKIKCETKIIEEGKVNNK